MRFAAFSCGSCAKLIFVIRNDLVLSGYCVGGRRLRKCTFKLNRFLEFKRILVVVLFSISLINVLQQKPFVLISH